MAYKSFRIRRVDLIASPDANPFGSYVRGTDTDVPAGETRIDSDSSLRADGFIAPVGELDVTAVFEATATTHSSVNLFWSNFLIEDPTTKTSGQTSIKGVVVVYSKTGAPETVADGVIIKEQNYADITYAVTHNDVPSGAWAYYSLFLHWNQNGTGPSGVNWYERVATLQELVPFDHHTTDALWDRVPSHHRVADVNGMDSDPEGLSRGYLYRYLDIFGFEFDRIRTLLNSVVQQYDPEKTETESLDQLSKMFGLEVSIQDLGASRIRQILKDIAYYRQRKGTLEATKQYLIAVTGSEVDVIESTTSPRYTFNIHAEKANLVADSLFVIESGTKKWALSIGNDLTRTNLVTNPNFETNTTGWTSAQSSAVRSTDYAYKGTASYKITMSSSSDSNVASIGVGVNTFATTGTYTVSAYCYVPTGSTIAGRTITLSFESGTATGTEGTSSPATLVAGSWVRVSRPFTVTATGTKAIVFRLSGTLSTAVGRAIYIDSVLSEFTSSVLPYFDGTYADTYSGYTLDTQSWAGTANASISTSVWDSQLSYSKSGEFITITNNGSASAQFALTSLVSVPVDANTDYWSSIAMTGSASVYGSQWSASAGWAGWATTNQYDRVIPASLSPAGRSVILMPDVMTSTTAYPVIQFAIPAGGVTTISKWMVEPNSYGAFFNGDSDFGGFVYQNNFADHQWSGSQYASYSTYSTNRKKTQETIVELLPKLLPVTMLLDPSINFIINYDWIPGKT